ncbi:MAG: penicillin-binding transpeptidase domain-containing protein [Gemmatimonadota bacterium]
MNTQHDARSPVKRRRFLLVGIVCAALFMTGRAAQLQLVQSGDWQERAGDQHAKQSVLPAARGTIYDRDGVPLAASSEAFRINIAPREVTNRQRLAQRLQKLTKLDEGTVRRALDVKRRWVVLPGHYPSAVREALDGTQGVYCDRVLRRFYPHGDVAHDILGLVNRAGDPLGGIELEFDSILAGKPGMATLRRDSRGRAIPGAMLQAIEPAAGHDIYLTLDYDLQEIANEALRNAVQSTGSRGGEMILADPRTGEILASATVRDAPVRGWRAATEPYEPGSTLKPFLIATLLAQKAARLTDTIFAENGEYTHDGRTLRDVHAMSWMSVAEALQQSSNIALAKLSARLEPATQYEYLRAFGFGSPTAIQYPSESSGLLRKPQQWSRFSQASLAIGYEVSVTPLQMVLAYGALANGGVLMEPRLVREVRSRDARFQQTFKRRVVRRVIPQKVAHELREVLVGVVAEGSGQAAGMGPFEVAGKTGTARSFRAGHYERGAYTASFAGFFPAADPQLVFVVKLESPQGVYYGGFAAAPVTRATLEAALAARNTPLDKRALAVAAPRMDASDLAPIASAPATARRPVSGPFIFALAPREAGSLRSHAGAPNRVTQRVARYTLPNVVGLPLRDAVRQLHASGYRVQIEGNGVVRRAGSDANTRALVRLVAGEVTP